MRGLLGEELDVTSPYEDWVGREEHFEEVILASKVQAMAATLDWDSAPGLGDPLPPGWHWMFFNPVVPRRSLGADGHPQRGGFLPPIEPARRMWAGSRIRYDVDLPVGRLAQRVSRIQHIEHKVGKSGSLWFVTVRHTTTCEGALCMSEDQDIVYRDMSSTTSSSSSSGGGPILPPADWSMEVQPDATLLFRYSALTFNGHRIHYDADYARQVEGYPDLVVHGPLTATLLQQLAAHHTGRALAEFSFRGVSPLFCGRRFRVHGRRTSESDVELWATGPSGELAMSARARLR